MQLRLTVQRSEKRNSIAALRAEILDLWHPTKNGELTPRDVGYKSRRPIWWRCRDNPAHEWLSPTHSHTGGMSCPICANRVASQENNLAVRFPVVAAQWHPILNGESRPEEVVPGSTKRVWWECSIGHEWIEPIQSRVASKTRCRYCDKPGSYTSAARDRARASRSRAVRALAPLLARQWHPTKNGDLRPSKVTLGADRKFWWRCPDDPRHAWQARPLQRLVRPECPLCRPEFFKRGQPVALVAPGLIGEWHPTKNGPLTPHTVPARSHQRIWWQCRKGPDHEWDTDVRDRAVEGAACPYCVGRLLSVTNSLAAKYPALAADWHPTKNGELKPGDVLPASRERVWWQCRKDSEHVWDAMVRDRVSNVGKTTGHGCPYCSHHRVLVSTSLAGVRPGLAEQWHPTRNGILTPSDVTARSHRLVWWKCPAGPDHEWEMAVSQRTHGRNVHCPFCGNRRLSVTNAITAKAPKIVYEWHPTKNGTLTPDQVVATKKDRFWWKCSRGHVWQASAFSRTVLGRGCRKCKVRPSPVVTTRRRKTRVWLPSDWE